MTADVQVHDLGENNSRAALLGEVWTRLLVVAHQSGFTADPNSPSFYRLACRLQENARLDADTFFYVVGSGQVVLAWSRRFAEHWATEENARLFVVELRRADGRVQCLINEDTTWRDLRQDNDEGSIDG